MQFFCKISYTSSSSHSFRVLHDIHSLCKPLVALLMSIPSPTIRAAAYQRQVFGQLQHCVYEVWRDHEQDSGRHDLCRSPKGKTPMEKDQKSEVAMRLVRHVTYITTHTFGLLLWCSHCLSIQSNVNIEYCLI